MPLAAAFTILRTQASGSSLGMRPLRLPYRLAEARVHKIVNAARQGHAPLKLFLPQESDAIRSVAD